MPRKIVPKTSFLGGEAGFLLEGRSDLAQFQLGKGIGQNFISLKGGADTRRPGTRYVKNTLADKPAKLIPFVVSYDSGASIFVFELALASSTSVTIRTVKVSDNSVGTVTGNSPLTVATMTESELQEIQYAQIANRMFLVSKHFTPQTIDYNPATGAFTITNYMTPVKLPSMAHGGFTSPYRTTNASAVTLSIDVETVGTGRTLTASSGIFDAGHEGSFWAIKTSGAAWGYVFVQQYNSSTSLTVQVLAALGAAASATTEWAEGSWSTYRGFPRSVTLYGQRSAFGGNTAEPDTFWMSQVGDYQQMSVDIGTGGIDDPLNFTLASNKLNQIRWMIGGKKLSIGTTTSEWVGTVTNDGTNLFVQFDEETTHGSAPVQPQKSAYTIPFVQRSGRSIREMAFNFDNDAYEATDLTLFASHVGWPYGRFKNSSGVRIVQMAYQESPFNVLWALDSFGRLFGLTRDKQQNIAAWHSHSVGGYITELLLTGLTGSDYPPIIKSICVLPDSNGRQDRLWMVVQREIDGVIKYHVEYMDDIKTHPYKSVGSTGDVKAFLDCATLATGAAATLWTGYTRFAGDNAYVVAEDANGAIVHCGVLAVNGSGEITLPIAATKVVVGLHADAIMRLLPLEGGDAPQVNTISEKAVDSAAIRLHETWGLRIGRNRIMRKTGDEENTTFEPIPFDNTSLPLVPTFTGVRVVPVPSEDASDASFALAMKEPWSCTILSISSRLVHNEV